MTGCWGIPAYLMARLVEISYKGKRKAAKHKATLLADYLKEVEVGSAYCTSRGTACDPQPRTVQRDYSRLILRWLRDRPCLIVLLISM